MFNDIEENKNEIIIKNKSIGITLSNNKMKSILFGCKGYYN